MGKGETKAVKKVTAQVKNPYKKRYEKNPYKKRYEKKPYKRALLDLKSKH